MTTAGTVNDQRPSGAESILAGSSFKELVDIDDDELEALYAVAYNEYEQGQYAAAETIFQVLCFHDHKCARFWLGLGATRQQKKDYGGAIMAYSMLPEIGSADPTAPLRAAECYIALGLFEEAVSGLEAAIDWADNGNREAVIRHVELLFQALEQMLENDGDTVEGDAR